MKIEPMTVALEKSFTVEQYLQLERRSGERYAFYDGKIERMAGGTIAHNRIARNLLGLLYNLTVRKPHLEVFASDQKIYLPEYRYYLYPDAVVVAGVPVETEAEASAIVNPLLIFEVFFPSTARTDQNIKFFEYQSIPSFQEYVLLRQDQPAAIRFWREGPDLWRRFDTKGLEGDILLQSIEESLAMKAVYERVELE
jgi:Uma2 family endonuclease